MPYSAQITRANPSCFLFLIDQSGSMHEVFEPSNPQPMEQPIALDGQRYTHTATGPTKAQKLADVVNKLLTNLTLQCAKSEGIRDYFHIGVLGYGGDNTANRVQPAFAGALAGRELVPIHEIADCPARIEERTKKVEDGAGGLVDQKTKFPVWFDATANGGTPMCAAFRKAKDILSGWTTQHPNSFPPVVINISDGESTDGDPSEAGDALRGLNSLDGNVLLFNIHVSAKSGDPILFADSDATLTDENAKRHDNLSSLLPPTVLVEARKQGFPVNEMARGFAFNADLVALIKFLNIGTTVGDLR